jgi:hypothetical protein
MRAPGERLLAFALLLRPQDAGELELCGDCHPAQASSYRETGMARALEPLRAGELAGLEEVHEPSTGFTYRFEGAGGPVLVEEHPGTAGGPPRRDSAPVAFAIGAGLLDRSYALERHGRLWLAPLEAVGPPGERHAALAPSHAISPGTRFAQPVTPECLACHTDAPPPRGWPLNRRVPGWEPRGISCAACHGELAGHVRFRSAELAGESPEGADPVLALKRLGRVQRLSICAACHLQGDARIELVPGVGPPPPGGDLLEERAVFVAARPTDEIGFVSHVQRLVLSRCYLESGGFPGGGLACESCHDPHRSVFLPQERARVRAGCTACHGPGPAADCSLPRADRPAGGDCAACHMRRTGVFDVAGVEIHDHWIRRASGPPGGRGPLRFPESSAGEWRRFAWPDSPPPGHVDDPGLLLMALAHGGHLERALALVDRSPLERVAALPMYQHVRGSLLERAGRLPDARAAYQRALALDPKLCEPAVNLGPLLARLGEPRAGLALLDRLIAAHPLADTALRNRAVVRLELGDEAGCQADLERAQRLLPDAVLARALARLAARRGEAGEERRWLEEARRLDPRSE